MVDYSSASTKSSMVIVALPADMLTVHLPPLTVMGADFTFAKSLLAGMGVVESAPPQPLAMSCPPLPVAFAQTDRV